MTAVSRKRVAARWIVMVVFALAFTLSVAATTAPRTLAASYCQCTTYAQQHFGLSTQAPWNYPNAANWGDVPDPNYPGSTTSYLGHNGWHAVNAPASGDILIVEKPYQTYVSYTQGGSTWPYWIANSTAGHVGYVANLTCRAGTGCTVFNVEIRSANTGLTSHYYTDGNCNDVADFWWVVDSSYPGTFQFWAK
jgi:hypothetical protein